MDRDRLKEVHQSDLSEAKYNEEFVEWLKTKGWTWLIVILAALASYMAVVKYKQGQIVKKSDAWRSLYSNDLPSELEDVARDHGDVGQVGALALLKAADRYLAAIQLGRPMASGASALPGAATITDEERTDYIARADGLYEQVLEGDDGSVGTTLLAFEALMGRAAIAECRGEPDAARQWYDRAGERGGDRYPGLVELASQRSSSADSVATDVTFMGQRDINAAEGTPQQRAPVDFDESLRELIFPDEAEADGAAGTP